MTRLAVLFFLSIILFIPGCETEPILFNGPYHVRFTENNLTKKESYSEIIKIEVHYAGPLLDDDLKIGYEISGSARKSIDYSIIGDENNVTISKDQYFGYIQVKLINNANNILRSQDLKFTLRTVNNSQVEIGQGPGVIGNTFTLTIQDDCILSGTYSGIKNVFDIPVEGIQLSSNDCENYLLSNWNINFFDPPFDYSLNFIDNGDNTLTVPEQNTDTKLKGKGIVDPITNKITFTLILLEFDNEEITFILTKK